MKKRIFLMLFALLAVVFVLASCGHDEHSFTVEKEVVPATCVESGYKVMGCTECDQTENVIIPSLGHDYVNTVIAPTCKLQGYTTQKCSRCGDTNSDAKLDIKQPTGEHKFEHVEGSLVEPTCKESGYELQKCTECGFERKYNSTEKLVHKYTEHLTTVTAPTCTEPGMGISTKTCDYCGEKDPDYTDKPNVVIPALTHDIMRNDDYLVAAMRIEATCTTKQHDTWACKREGCDYTEEADVGEPLGHDWTVEAGIAAAATCHSLETKIYKCVRDGQIGCVETPAQGPVSKVIATPDSYAPHTPGAPADCDTDQICTQCVAAGRTEVNTTCTLGDDRCTACVFEGKAHLFATATGDHDYDVATGKGLLSEKTVAPTCMRRGYSVYLCTGCNKEYNDNYTDIVPTAHNVDYDSMVGGSTIAATCIKYEYSVHACTNTAEDGTECDYTTERTVGNTYADHTFSNGEPTGVATCTHCQKSFYDTTYTEGVYAEYEDKEFDDNASLDVTITVSKEVADPMKLTNTATSGTQVDGEHPDTTKIAIIRIVTDNSDVKFTVTVNGNNAGEITGAGYIDICDIGDITSLVVSSEGTGEYEATVYFYGETAIPATVSGE